MFQKYTLKCTLYVVSQALVLLNLLWETCHNMMMYFDFFFTAVDRPMTHSYAI